MKFSTAISTALFALPLLAEAFPSEIDARAVGRQRFGQGRQGQGQGRQGQGQGGAQNKGNNGNNGAAAAAAAAAAAKKNNGGSAGSKGGSTAASSTAAAGKAASSAAATTAAAAASTSVVATGQAQKGASIQDAQNSLQLDPSQVMQNLASDGQAVAEAGQVPSLTSKNNFINFCLTRPQRVLTDGEQVVAGSCNPVPMGDIVAKNVMPAGKFRNPKNLDTIAANTAFTIELGIQNLNTGNFVNPNTNYYAAPAQCDGSGILIGHSHVTVQQIQSLTDTSIPDPTVFQFFKGFNLQASGGVLSADVTAGLAEGVYRMCSIHTAANHQPALGAVAQHGMFDDCTYFTVSGNGGGNGGNGGNSGAAASSSAAATSSAAAASNTASSGKAAGNGANGGATANKGGATANKGGSTANKGGAAANKGGAAANKGGFGRGRNGRGRGRGRY